uniref:BMERB domain-containing protein n=1 Tax=Anopheles merus TaxID=30066 RepID=A0A182UUU9_ANOME
MKRVHLLFLYLCPVSGASNSEVNSTEISTDSEFDDEQPQRVPPSFHLEFKPLVEVDPTIKLVQNRAPLAVPRPGDYVLSKTASTEGIASKKSLELKKKYLLGEGTTGLGILKSGSASALDSKFKTFHSNITECQKLLNPAAAVQVSPTLQPFLKASAPAAPVPVTPVAPGPTESANDTEKENVYEGKRSGNGQPNVVGSVGAGAANKRSSLVETINTTLVENKLNEIKSSECFPALPPKEEPPEQPPVTSPAQNGSPAKPSESNGHLDHAAKLKNSINNNNNHSSNGTQNNNNHHHHTPVNNKANNHNNNNNNGEEEEEVEVIEIIDIVTPEKGKATTASPTHREVASSGATHEPIAGPERKYIGALKHAYIDLTTDSPNCDRSLVETTLDFSIAPSKVAGGGAGAIGPERPTNSNAMPDPASGNARNDSNDNTIEQTANGGLAERQPPKEQQRAVEEEREQEEGCHETTLQVPLDHGDERFVPRLEVRDATGELMQIDSLMIIDGRYIGDPEDLKLMERLPPDTQIAAQLLQAEMNQDSISTVVESAPEHPGQAERNADEQVVPAEEEEEEEERASTPTPPPAKPEEPVAEDQAATTTKAPSLSNFVSQRTGGFRFDSLHEHKLDTLKNLPFVLEAQRSAVPPKPTHLSLAEPRPPESETDAEQTPMAGEMLPPLVAVAATQDPDSDSPDDTEVTTQNNLTETELSDWAADDAVSENFVDLEFGLGAGRGATVRRNQKPKHLRLPAKRDGGPNARGAVLPLAATAPLATEDGIIRNLALEDIEFMDTGSEEESCIETYATTNRMVVKNRGYMEIMDPAVEAQRTVYHPPPPVYGSAAPLVEAINSQVAGRQLDYIEQGAYLLAADDAKTPMNEEPPGKGTFPGLRLDADIEEDSLLLVSSSQGTGTATDSTYGDSDATTIVGPAHLEAGGRPLAGGAAVASPKPSSGSSGRGSAGGDVQEEQQDEQEEQGDGPVRKISVESLSGKRSSLERKDVRRDSLKSIEDIGYEKYVKRLQQKIQQISKARDSLEVMKSAKRKSPKADGSMVALPLSEAAPPATAESVPGASPKADQPQQQQQQQQSPQSPAPAGTPEPPKSVEKKIEEIAKERVKQKDLIHDLVMDKLQTKKQLNAEKRLNRSRNRSNALGGQQSAGVADVPPAVDGASPARAAAIPLNGGPAAPVTPVALATPRAGGDAAPTTGQLREEARSRARLKSNQDLGLSPEDQVLLLRKKYHLTMRALTNTTTDDDDDANNRAEPNKSDDAKCKDQQQQQHHRTKLITSKSVNDVSMLKQQQQHHHHHHHHYNQAALAHRHHHHLPHQHSQQPSYRITSAGLGAATGELADPPALPHKLTDYISDPNLVHSGATEPDSEVRVRGAATKRGKDRERRKSIIEKVSEFFNGRKKPTAADGAGGSKEASPTKDRPPSNLLAVNGQPEPVNGGGSTSPSSGGGFLRFKISPKLKDKSKTKESSPYGARCASDDCLNTNGAAAAGSPTITTPDAAGPNHHHHNSYTPIGRKEAEELEPPPIPPLPLNYERSDDEAAGAANESKNEIKKIRAMSKTSRQAELKRLRIAQEIQREQAEIDVKIKDLETRGVAIEKELRGESEALRQHGPAANLGANDEGLVKEWLDIMSSITRLKVRDDELSIRQQELQLEHRHAQLKEELNMRLSYGKLDKNSSDVAAEGAILNEMLEIVAKRQSLRPSPDTKATAAAVAAVAAGAASSPFANPTGRKPNDTDLVLYQFSSVSP